MKISSTVVNEAPRPSATVIMLRDTAQGMEVFLVRRHSASAVLGGAYVFPGGKLDDADLLLNEERCLDSTALALHQTLNEPHTPADVAKGLYVAALREAFEESGVLYANVADAAQQRAAAQMLQNGTGFNAMLEELSLRLHTQSVVPWSRWITPLMPSVSSKRFDTRFFVARVPQEQVARHDDVETTQSVWLQPADALKQYWNHDIEMAPPQIMTLAHLSRFSSAEAVLDAARSTPAPSIQPEPFDLEGTRVICYPGDPSHSVVARAMPGPTRLLFRNRRFEPEGGFQEWLSGDGSLEA